MKYSRKSTVFSILFVLLGLVEIAQAMYIPQLGRFDSRDPIEERGGVHLYSFAERDPVNKYDAIGLAWKEGPERESISAANRQPMDTTPGLPPIDPAASRANNPNILYNLANSELSDSLVDHYLFGNGGDYEVTAHTDILAKARKDKWKKVEDEKWRLLKQKVKDFQCPLATGTKRYLVQGPTGSGRKGFDFKHFHSGIGWASLWMNYDVYAYVVCMCCETSYGELIVKNHAVLVGDFKYDFQDQFMDAADWRSKKKGNQEYVGGTPFNITGAWDVQRRQSIHIESCPE